MNGPLTLDQLRNAVETCGLVHGQVVTKTVTEHLESVSFLGGGWPVEDGDIIICCVLRPVPVTH